MSGHDIVGNGIYGKMDIANIASIFVSRWSTVIFDGVTVRNGNLPVGRRGLDDPALFW